MAISEFSAGPLRKCIGFSHALPKEKVRRVFEKRGYECYLLTEAVLKNPVRLGATDSVVLTQTQNDPYQVRKDLERFANILNYDCRLYVRYAPDARLKNIILRTLSRLRLPPSGLVKTDAKFFGSDWFEGYDAPVFAPFVHVLEASNNWDSLANLIASNPADRIPNAALDIDPRDAKYEQFPLPEEDKLLLKRAFWNCSSIKLVEKESGLSGVSAFGALARLAGTGNIVGGDWPYRYFVKLGARLKVAREFEKYRATALENVPYHLGPRLRMDRCVLGRSQGIIVSDYVECAEPLRDCARDGRGIPAIGNLFNQTLIAWRRAATEEDRPLQQVLASLLPKKIPEHREPLIHAYGATKTLEELKALIEHASPSHPVLTGMIHGDLHATNVLVRMNDAVIIDLERTQAGMPLLFDAASLEGGLFVDGFIKDLRPGEEVLDSIRPLYTAAAFDHDDHYCHPGNRSAWFLDSARQIRMQARQMERQPRQYGWTLAAVLLKKACNCEDFREVGEGRTADATPLTREAVRALAYVLAEQILMALSEGGDLPVP